MQKAAGLELAEVAASTGPLPQRSLAMLQNLRRVVPFDGAWMALAEPMSSRYTSLASSDLDDGTVEYLSGPRWRTTSR